MLERVDVRASAKFIQEVKSATLEVPTPAASRTPLQLLPKVQRGSLPQIFGANFGGDPDGNGRLELEGHERVNIRLIFGISF